MAKGSRNLGLAVPGSTVAEQLDYAAMAESHGFESVWVAENGGHDAVSRCAALGMRLQRARVGSGIMPTGIRNPFLMAMTATTLNELLDGRFVLGLGSSTRLIVEDWHGGTWRRPLSSMRAYVDLLRRFLAGERVSAELDGLQYRNAALRGVKPRPPRVFLAALNDRMLELAGELADGVILNFPSLAYLERAMAHLSAGAGRAGRSLDDIEVVGWLRVTVDADFDEVRDAYRREFFSYVMAPPYQRMFTAEGFGDACKAVEARWNEGDRRGAPSLIPDELMENRAVVGSLEACRERLDRYFDAGLDTVMVTPVPRRGEDYRAGVDRILGALGGAYARA